MTIALPPITPETSQVIVRLAKGYVDGPDNYGVVKAVQISGALPVHGSIAGVLYIRPDGEVLSSGLDCESMPEVESEDGMRAAAYVAASEKYPELHHLRPPRPTTAHECRECRGTGLFYPGISCGYCWSVGWIDAPV